MMQKAKKLPAGNIKMPKAPNDLNRLTDHLVARLRDIQTILADHQPECEPEKMTGSGHPSPSAPVRSRPYLSTP
jgi:hypothetical protein